MNRRERTYYEDEARRHRGTPQQFAWGSERSQTLRFDVLLDVLEALRGPEWRALTLLDFGCGGGDLLGALERRGFSGSYVGVDGVAVSIEDARARHGHKPRVTFIEKSWDGSEIVAPFDVCVVSGAFNLTRPTRRNRIVRRLLAQAKVGVVMNFLQDTDRVDFDDDNVLTTPAEICALIDATEFKLLARADYMPHDFTVGAVRW